LIDRNIISKNIKVQGFIIMNYAKEFKTALEHLRNWVQTGAIKSKEQIVEGLENCPDALQMLFTGRNTGKVIVKVQQEPRL
jgi:NADPH-dependent curcumin reductase CurA